MRNQGHCRVNAKNGLIKGHMVLLMVQNPQIISHKKLNRSVLIFSAQKALMCSCS